MRFSVVAAILSAVSFAVAAPAESPELAKRQTLTGDGACGWWNGDYEWVAAVSSQYFETFPGYTGGNPNKNPVCGRTHYHSDPANGKTITLGIVDRCGGCKYGDLDLSPSAFQALVGDLGVGRASGIQWSLV